MTAALAIIAVVISAMGVYYMARSDVRERKRLAAASADKKITDAVAEAVTPLRRDNDELRLENRELRLIIRDRDKRIDDLEDELRRRPR